MRIVNLDEFRKMPPGTFFQKYKPDVFGDLAVLDDVWDTDFVVNHITSCPINGKDMSETGDRLDDMVENGTSRPVCFDFIARDGCFEKDQLFAVWEEADLDSLIAFARNALRVTKGRQS